MVTTYQAPIWELPAGEQRVEGLDQHGSPDPAYAAALGLLSAPLGRRAAAAAVDIGIFVLMQLPVVFFAAPLFRRLLAGRITWYGFVNHPDFLVSVIVAGVSLLLTILLIVGQLMVQGRWGFTVGKLATGLRVVNVATLARSGFWRATWRALVAWLPVVTIVGTPVVLASPLWAGHDSRRGWHDRAGRAWVIDVRRGLDPFDKKRMRVARKTITSTPAARLKNLPSLASSAGGDASSAYRPGARTSAGVLGAARPHAPYGRVVVGLTGLVPGEPVHVPEESAGLPRLGGYLTGAPAVTPSDGAPAPADPAGRHSATSGRHDTAPMPTAQQEASVPRGAPPQAPAVSGPRRERLAPPGSSAPHVGSVTLVLDNDQSIEVRSAVVLGRSPVSVDGAMPMAIVDAEFSISKTHVLLRPVPGGLEVIDQGSTNGTTLVHDGQEQRMPAGHVGFARLGDTIRIGDRSARLLGS